MSLSKAQRYDIQFLRYIEEQTEICNFRSFFVLVHLKTKKIKILKNEKICWRYNHFTHMHQKSQSHDVRFLKYRVRQTKFFVILGHFLPFQHPHQMILIIKIKKDNKNAWRYYPFIHTCVP